jgi:hypothetical protein
MDYVELNLVRPKRSWFQFRLKTLFLLLVIAGSFLALYLFWDDWRKQRPPHQEYDDAPYRAAFIKFANDFKQGDLAHAYESTSSRFKQQMSRSELEILIYRFPKLVEIQLFDDRGFIGAKLNRTAGECQVKLLDDRDAGLRNGMTGVVRIRERAGRGIEAWVWVVMHDSFFCRRPPPPRVEELQIREIGEAGWQSETLPALLPSWDQEPVP